MQFLAHHFLRASAERFPDKPGVICDNRIHTFASLDGHSDSVAAELAGDGVKRGDRVAVFMENSAEFVVSVFGILKSGAVFVAINPTTKARKLAHILNDCGVRSLIAQPKVAGVVTEAAPQVPSLKQVIWTASAPETARDGPSFPELLGARRKVPTPPTLIDQDLCMIIYTSGTTGTPKGVMLTHQNVVTTARSIGSYLENTPGDVVCSVLPLGFSYGLYQMFVMALVGYTLLLEQSFAYPMDVLRRMAKHRVTGFPGVPGMFATLLQVVPTCDLDLGSLRYFTNAAGPISATHIRQLLKLFPEARFYSMHGQTECARTCYMDPARLLEKPDSIGRAMPNTELFIVDREGRRVGPNVVGELVVRGSNVMRGYWNMPQATAKKLRTGVYPGEKVLYTGDLFRMDEDGDFYFVSRTDDIIKCKGEKVSPKEVEDVLYELPGVREAAVVGVDDPIDGQAIKACLVPTDGVELTELSVRRHCRARLEGHMVPKYVEFRDRLPKTGSGKIRRNDLKEPGAAVGSGQPSQRPGQTAS